MSQKLKTEDQEPRVFEKHLYQTAKSILNNKKDKLSEVQLNQLKKYDNLARAEGLKWGTRGATLRRLEDLAVFLEKPFKEATKEDFVDYINSKNFKHNTKVVTLHTFRKFYRWLYDIEEGHPDCVKGGVFTKENLRMETDVERPDYTEEEILKAMEGARNYRDRLLIIMLAESGLRISELQILKLKHVKIDQQYAEVNVPADTKTGHRNVYLVKSLPDMIRYLEESHPKPKDPEAPLFCNVKRDAIKHLSYSTLRNAVGRAFERAGIEKKGGFHTFRRTAVRKDIENSSMSDQMLKAKYGWENDSKMLKIYNDVKPEQLKRAVLSANGIETDNGEKVKEKSKLEPATCPRCGAKNPVGAGVCIRCYSALDSEKAYAIHQEREQDNELMNKIKDKIENMENGREMFKEVMKEVLKENPDLLSK